MAGFSVKETKREEVLARAKQGKCLICERQAKQRGLCHAHYFQFYRAKMSLPKTERVEYERHHIREGRVLASGQSRQIKTPNPFNAE